MDTDFTDKETKGITTKLLRLKGEQMLGGGEGLGEEVGGVGERAVDHGGFKSEIALVSLERKGAKESGEVDDTLAGNQMVVGLAKVVVEVSGEQTMAPTTQDVEGWAGCELIVAGVVTEADGGGGELTEHPIERGWTF